MACHQRADTILLTPEWTTFLTPAAGLKNEERPSRSEQRTLSKTKNNRFTGKAPYKFEFISLQPKVGIELVRTSCSDGIRSFSGFSEGRSVLQGTSRSRLSPPLGATGFGLVSAIGVAVDWNAAGGCAA
jgi:hypothetical protein